MTVREHRQNAGLANPTWRKAWGVSLVTVSRWGLGNSTAGECIA
jgi:hypothetical protein